MLLFLDAFIAVLIISAASSEKVVHEQQHREIGTTNERQRTTHVLSSMACSASSCHRNSSTQVIRLSAEASKAKAVPLINTHSAGCISDDSDGLQAEI